MHDNSMCEHFAEYCTLVRRFPKDCLGCRSYEPTGMVGNRVWDDGIVRIKANAIKDCNGRRRTHAQREI